MWVFHMLDSETIQQGWFESYINEFEDESYTQTFLSVILLGFYNYKTQHKQFIQCFVED